jgi:outer membrane protein
VISQTRSAYAVWKSSLEVIASSETAVNANKLSLEGVRTALNVEQGMELLALGRKETSLGR